MKTDRELQHDVIEELEWEPQVDAAKIGVTTDHGVVTLVEFMALGERNFARCDLNKDGRIDTAECRQALQRKPAAR